MTKGLRSLTNVYLLKYIQISNDLNCCCRTLEWLGKVPGDQNQNLTHGIRDITQKSGAHALHMQELKFNP